MFRKYKRLRNILEIPMLSEVNKVDKDNPIFVSFLLYFVPPAYFDPPFNNFSKSLNRPPPPVYFDPPFIMNLRVIFLVMARYMGTIKN